MIRSHTLLLLCVIFFTIPMISFAQETTAPSAETVIAEATDAATGTIILKIDGLKKKKLRGDLRCRLYNSEETFPKKDTMFRTLVVPATAESLEVIIEDLPFGEYAVVVHHDRNRNGKSDKTWYRAPKEPIGCSRSAKGKFGPPKWNDAVFELNQESLDVLIHLK